MNTIYIKPASKGLIVRDPVTGQRLAEDGEAVTRSSYWMRRLRDGDVIETRPPKKSARKSEES